MRQSQQGRSLRCRFGIHTWVTRVNAGARWHECGRCGKYSYKVVMTTASLPRAGGKTVVVVAASSAPGVIISR